MAQDKKKQPDEPKKTVLGASGAAAVHSRAQSGQPPQLGVADTFIATGGTSPPEAAPPTGIGGTSPPVEASPLPGVADTFVAPGGTNPPIAAPITGPPPARTPGGGIPAPEARPPLTAPEIGTEPGGGLGGLPELPVLDPTALVGAVLGDRYRILKVLGQGGMGVVYLAEHVVIEKRVALKVLNEELSHSRDAVNRFIYEAKAASKIGHENIIDITDFGTTPTGGVFFTMEFLDGKDLGDHLKDTGPMPWDLVRRVGIQVCHALASAHSKGIIHRDLKPENIFLIQHAGRDDFVKILDFGIAKFTGLEHGAPKKTKTGMIFGTPDYMAPEQAEGHQADERVDIYALGIILYQLVTAKLPFEAETFMGVLHQHMTKQATPPRELVDNVPPDFERVILTAMAKRPEERYQTMEAFAEALEGVTGHPEALSAPETEPIEVDDSSLAASVADALKDDVQEASPSVVRGTSPSPAAVEPAKGGSKALFIVLGLVVVVVGLAVGAFFITRGGHKGEGTQTGQGETPPPMRPVPVPDAAPPRGPAMPAVPVMLEPPRPSLVRLHIVTQPRHAIVELDGKRIGRSPIRRYEIPYGDDEHTLTIRRRGYRTIKITFTPDANQSWDRVLVRGRGTDHVTTQRPRPMEEARLRPRDATRPRPRDAMRPRPRDAMRPRPRETLRPRPMPVMTPMDLKDPFGGM